MAFLIDSARCNRWNIDTFVRKARSCVMMAVGLSDDELEAIYKKDVEPFQAKEGWTKSIWYLLDLTNGRIVQTFEGTSGTIPPQGAIDKAESMSKGSRTFALSVGKQYFQPS